jgi:hypothetical protein
VVICERSTIGLAVVLEGWSPSGCEDEDIGPVTRLKDSIGGREKLITSLFPVRSFKLWEDFFGKPWEEVVCQRGGVRWHPLVSPGPHECQGHHPVPQRQATSRGLLALATPADTSVHVLAPARWQWGALVHRWKWDSELCYVF